MEKVSIDSDYVIVNNDEISVQVNYRCWFTEKKAFYPMDSMGSIYKGHSLQDFIKEHKAHYEKDYLKVEVVDVFLIDNKARLPENS